MTFHTSLSPLDWIEGANADELDALPNARETKVINQEISDQMPGAPTFVGLRFDYSKVERVHQPHLMAAALSIRGESAKARDSILEIGRQLLIAKELLPHGQFGEWLRVEFEMSERTAQNMMRVAEVYDGKSANVALFSDSVLYMLAAPSTPPEVRERVEVAFRETGEMPTRSQVKSLRDAHRQTIPMQGKAVYVESTAATAPAVSEPTPPMTDTEVVAAIAEIEAQWTEPELAAHAAENEVFYHACSSTGVIGIAQLDPRLARATALRDGLLAVRDLARADYHELTGMASDLLEFERGIAKMLPRLTSLINILESGVVKP